MPVLSKTIFLYDNNTYNRRELLRFLTDNSNYRVLCLDFLVQTFRQVKDMRPEAILCNPSGDFQEVVDMIKELNRSLPGYRTPIYILGGNVPPTRAQQLMGCGVKMIFEETASFDMILRAIKSKKSMNSFVPEPGLKFESKVFPNGEAYELVVPAFNESDEFDKLMKGLELHTFALDANLVILNLTYAETFSKENILSLINVLRKAKKDMFVVEMIFNYKHIHTFFKEEYVTQFSSLSECVNSHSIASNNGSDDLDDLLSLIPDF